MRRIGKAIAGLLFLASALLTVPGAGWAREFYYTRPHYFFLPIQMQFADRRTGNPISGNAGSSNVIMYGGDTREFFVDVVDFNGNGIIDIRDFKVWSVIPDPVSVDIIISGDVDALLLGLIPDVSLDISSVPPNLSTEMLLQMAPPQFQDRLRGKFEAAYLGALWRSVGYFHMTKSTQDLLDATLDDIGSNFLSRYNSDLDPRVNPPASIPQRVNLLRVTARQQLGDDGSGFKEQLAQLKYTLYWGASAKLNDEKEREKLSTRAETPQLI